MSLIICYIFLSFFSVTGKILIIGMFIAKFDLPDMQIESNYYRYVQWQNQLYNCMEMNEWHNIILIVLKYNIVLKIKNVLNYPTLLEICSYDLI